MRVKVLYFGVLRDLFGGPDELAELPDGATVGDLLRVLRGRTSNYSAADELGGRTSETDDRTRDDGLWRSLAVAVNREYCLQSVMLRDGDEVALLPPVSGGAGEG